MAVSNNIKLDFVGVGVSKSATTWVAKMLAQHPHIYIPPNKELHYFNGRSGKYDPRLQHLKNIFGHKENTINGEFTPRYIISSTAIKRLKHHFPAIKLIICLRNPLERAISQYKYFFYEKKKENITSFPQAIDKFYYDDYVEKSLYHKHIKYIFNKFPRNQIKIIWYKDIQNKPDRVLEDLLKFIGAPHLKLERTTQPINKTKDKNKKVSLIENYYFKIITNIKLKRNFKHTNEYWILHLLSSKKIFSKTFKLLRPAIYILAYIEKQLTDRRGHYQLSYREKKRIYNKFFKKDIEQLEQLLETDLSDWKY